jgi:hypothetical protein
LSTILSQPTFAGSTFGTSFLLPVAELVFTALTPDGGGILFFLVIKY